MRLNRALPLLVAVGAAASTVLLGPAAAGATTTAESAIAPVGFSASAYGTKVKVADGLVGSGRTALVTIGCTQRTPLSRHNNTAAVDLEGIGHLGAVTSRARTRGDEASQQWSSSSRAEVAGASLLPGVIELGAIRADARAQQSGQGFGASTDFSIASLTIAGAKVEVTGEEQVIDIAGVGTLTLGRSSVREAAGRSSASITAVELRLLDSTVITLGRAEAAIGRAPNAVFAGGAYGSTVKVAGTADSGRTAWQPISCLGTRGNVRTNEVLDADLGGLGTAGVITSTVRTLQSPTAEAMARSEITDVDLGLLELDGIVADVHVTEASDGTVSYDTSGSELGSVTLAGIEVALPEPGGTVVLPGLGTLTFLDERELADGRGVQVTTVRLELGDDTVIVLGRAAATIK